MLATWSATPEEPLAPSPTASGNCLPSESQSPVAAFRNFWKFAEVPDSSERKMTVMSLSGRSVPSLSAAMALSFHFLISPLKILPRVSVERLISVSPRL